MRYSIRTVTPLAEIDTVISVDEAKQHLRVESDFTDDDALIESYARAAQDAVERLTSQILTVREMELAVRGFPCSAIELPREPVTAITAIAYLDGSGGAAELEAGDWRWSESNPGQVLPAIGTSWPAAYDEDGSVRVTFEAGYEEGLCPASLIAAVKLLLGHFYTNREAVVTGTIATDMPQGVAALCAPYRRILI